MELIYTLMARENDIEYSCDSSLEYTRRERTVRMWVDSESGGSSGSSGPETLCTLTGLNASLSTVTQQNDRGGHVLGGRDESNRANGLHAGNVEYFCGVLGVSHDLSVSRALCPHVDESHTCSFYMCDACEWNVRKAG